MHALAGKEILARESFETGSEAGAAALGICCEAFVGQLRDDGRLQLLRTGTRGLAAAAG